MYEKIKNFIIGHKYIVIFSGICIILFTYYMFRSGENLSNNRESINTIRNELYQAEGAKQDITGTASNIEGTSSDIANTSKNIEGTINTATDASSNFESILNECTEIIEQIRKQSE